MQSFELILLLLGSVLVSTVFSGFIPRVSLPLVQIAIGAVVATVWQEPLAVQIDPELFLVLFIAPLLFEEARQANKRALWNAKGAILSLAIGLVIVTVLVVGFCLNALVPSIPLAAAFALGAALGPTDAVAVTALSKDIKLSERQQTLLSGEALINDASGVVSFQFAIAAATTGAFSLVDATFAFSVAFFGGVLVGVACGLVAVLVLKALANQGFEDTTVRVVFEVFTPFVVFLAAEHAETSGILAVVAAGLVMTFWPEKPTVAASEQKVVSGYVWDVLVYVINGVIFVLLGMELALLVSPTWEFTGMSRLLLIGSIFLVTFIVLAVRFAWIACMEAVRKDPQKNARAGASRALLKNALVATLAGPKGALTLSIAFTIPYFVGITGSEAFAPFPHRSDLIFLASGVIVITLLLANFVVPVLSPRPDSGHEAHVAADVAILRKVICQLRDGQADRPDPAVTAVIANYEERIGHLMSDEVDLPTVKRLRMDVLEEAIAFVEAMEASGDVPSPDAQAYAERLEKAWRKLNGRHGERHALKRGRSRALSGSWARIRKKLGLATSYDEGYEHRRVLVEGVERVAIEYLEGLPRCEDQQCRQAVVYLLSEHRMNLRLLEAADAAALAQNTTVENASLDTPKIRRRIEEVEAEALRLELGQIRRAQEAGDIGPKHAGRLREQVYLLQMAIGED